MSRLWPQKVRTRLALLYASLFLISGSALARSVSVAHAAQLDVASQPEGGLCITVLLPPLR